MDVLNIFQSNIIDNSDNNIKFYLTKTKGHYVLHILNQYGETLNTSNDFFKQIIEMLFDQDVNTKNGCFNYEHEDDDILYDSTFNDLLKRFLSNRYTIILIDKEFNPLSYLCINDNTLWSLCTNNLYRNKGYMTILLKHIFKLIHKNKLKIDIDLHNLLIYIKKNNPIKKQLYNYYETFGFKGYKDLSDFIIMKYK